MITNPYKILGVPDGASEEECTKAYKKLAKKYHPDLNPNNKEAERKMAEINAAYDQIKSGTASQTQNAYNYGYRSSSSRSSSSAPDYLNSAAQFIRTGQYQQAINLLNNIESRDARWYYLSAIANMSIGNRAVAEDHIRTAYAKEPNNLTYQRAYQQITSGVNPMEYNPFSSFFDFGDFTQNRQENQYNNTQAPVKRRSCLGRIFKIILIIIIIRLVLNFITNFSYYNSMRRYNQQYNNHSYSQEFDDHEQYEQDAPFNYFGEQIEQEDDI